MDNINRNKLINNILEYSVNGYFIIYTDDVIYNKLIRTSLLSHVNISPDKVIYISTENELIKRTKKIQEENKNFLLFIEKNMESSSNAQLIKFIRATYPFCYMLLSSDETKRDVLIYLHELGINNFIIKPVSSNTIIEKVSLTIKPHGALDRLVMEAKKYLNKGNNQAVLDISNKILSVKPDSSIGHMLMGDAYTNLKQYENALKSYISASQSAKMFIEPIKRIADLYKIMENNSEYIKQLEKLDGLSPINIERKVELGTAYLNSGDDTIAKECFDNAKKLAKKEARNHIENVMIEIAEACLKSNNASLAEEYYKEVLKHKNTYSANDIYIFNRLGISLRRQGKWKEAIQEYQKVLNIGKENASILYNLGMAQLEGGLYEDAYQSFTKSYKLDETSMMNNDVSLFNFAICCERLHKYKEAIKLYKYVKEINPNFKDIDRKINIMFNKIEQGE